MVKYVLRPKPGHPERACSSCGPSPLPAPKGQLRRTRWGWCTRVPGPSLAGACWTQTEDPSGCGAASPSQGRWDPDSLRPALSLGGQASAWEGSPGCLENPRDGGAWWATVHGVAKTRTRLSDFTFTFHFPALEKEMAIHSSILAWRIPWTKELGMYRHA